MGKFSSLRLKGFFNCDCGKLHMVSALIMAGSKCACGRYLINQMLAKCGSRVYR